MIVVQSPYITKYILSWNYRAVLRANWWSAVDVCTSPRPQSIQEEIQHKQIFFSTYGSAHTCTQNIERNMISKFHSISCPWQQNFKLPKRVIYSCIVPSNVSRSTTAKNICTCKTASVISDTVKTTRRFKHLQVTLIIFLVWKQTQKYTCFPSKPKESFIHTYFSQNLVHPLLHDPFWHSLVLP